MKHRKKTLVALIVFAVLVVVVLVLERTPDRGVRVAPRERPVPRVDRTQVKAMTITNKGQSLTLQREKTGWKITNPINYAADAPAVDRAIAQLADMEFGDLVTTRKERHADLQVDPATGVRVQVGTSDAPAADFYLGKTVAGFTMLRTAKDSRVFQVVGSLRSTFAKELRLWRNRRIIDFKRENARKLESATPAGTIVLTRPDAKTQWAMERSTTEVAQLDIAAVTSLLNTLSSLRTNGFVDKPTAAHTTALAHPDATVTVQLADGARPQIVLARHGKDEVLAQRQGQGQIFSLKEHVGKGLIKRPIDFRDKTMINAKPADIAALVVTKVTGRSRAVLRLIRTDDAWKANGKAATKPDKIKKAVATLARLRATEFAHDDAAALGLRRPAWRVKVRLSNGSTVKLTIGGIEKNGAYGAQLSRSKDVYMLRKYTLDRFLLDPKDF